jgi:hypothetical protein
LPAPKHIGFRRVGSATIMKRRMEASNLSPRRVTTCFQHV